MLWVKFIGLETKAKTNPIANFPASNIIRVTVLKHPRRYLPNRRAEPEVIGQA